MMSRWRQEKETWAFVVFFFFKMMFKSGPSSYRARCFHRTTTNKRPASCRTPAQYPVALSQVFGLVRPGSELWRSRTRSAAYLPTGFPSRSLPAVSRLASRSLERRVRLPVPVQSPTPTHSRWDVSLIPEQRDDPDSPAHLLHLRAYATDAQHNPGDSTALNRPSSALIGFIHSHLNVHGAV